MDIKFRVGGRIARPVGEVFEAVVNPTELSHYFTTGGAKGRLETGATVYWDFADFPGAFPVDVIEVEKDKRIVLAWEASETARSDDDHQMGGAAYKTRITMTFEGLDDGRTLVQISEEGWRETTGGLKAAFGNCEGWTGMLAALKMWVEHKINLRDGFYK